MTTSATPTTSPTSPTPGAASAATPADTEQLVSAWLQLWNGDLDAAPTVLDQHLEMHVARIDGASNDTGPDALVSWITTMRTVMPDLNFDIEVGPFTDGDVVILRWVASGHYATGFPGATSPAGTPVRFTGTDILRTCTTQDSRQPRVAEYWLNTDMHVLLAQLGILAG